MMSRNFDMKHRYSSEYMFNHDNKERNKKIKLFVILTD